MSKRSWQLRTNPLVAAAIAQKMREREDRTKVTQDRVLNELAIIGFSDVSHYKADPVTGVITVKDGVPQQAMRAISKVKNKVNTVDDGVVVSTTRETDLKLWNKIKALSDLAKSVGLFDRRPQDEPEPPAPQVWKIGDREMTF
jgi:phage terminase small subunit